MKTPSVEQRTPTASLAVAGMNDVLNSQAYTQAAGTVSQSRLGLSWWRSRCAPTLDSVIPLGALKRESGSFYSSGYRIHCFLPDRQIEIAPLAA